MRLLTKAAFAALLLGTTAIAAPAFADDTGCPPGLHRADSERSGQQRRPPRRLRGRSEQRGPPGRLRGRSEQRGPPRRLRGRSEQRGPPVLTPRAVRTTRSAAPTPRAVRTTRSAVPTPRVVRTTTRSAAPTPRAVRTTRSARPTPRAARTTRSAALTPRVVRTTTQSAALRRSHPRARQRSRPASNRLAPATAISSLTGPTGGITAGRDFCAARLIRPSRAAAAHRQRNPARAALSLDQNRQEWALLIVCCPHRAPHIRRARPPGLPAPR